jgi:hypothetical protein
VDGETLHSRDEILRALAASEREVAAFFSSLTDDELIARVGSAWTSAEQLDHLNLAVRAVARGFSMRPWLLRMLFGRAGSPSRGFDEVRDTYRSGLARGAGAARDYLPRREQLAAAEVAGRRAELVARWARVNAAVRHALSRWHESDLDRVRLPHPILGKITAREMLFFMLYHNGHHVAAAKGRFGLRTPAP